MKQSILIVLVSTFILISCGQMTDKSIVGKWQTVDVEKLNEKLTIRELEDDTYFIKIIEIKESGKQKKATTTFTYKDRKLTFQNGASATYDGQDKLIFKGRVLKRVE